MDLCLIGDSKGGKVRPALVFRPPFSVDGQIQTGADGKIQRGHGAQKVGFLFGQPEEVVGIEFAVHAPSFRISAYIEQIPHRGIAFCIFKGVLI